jgi:hypothetical protein
MNIWLCITLRANRVFYCKHTTHTVSSVHVCFGMTMEAFVTSGLLCMCKNPNMSGRENENSWPSLYVHTLCLYVCVCMYVFTYPKLFCLTCVFTLWFVFSHHGCAVQNGQFCDSDSCMRLCIYVCLFVFMYVRTYVCVCACWSICLLVYVSVGLPVCAYVGMFVYMYMLTPHELRYIWSLKTRVIKHGILCFVVLFDAHTRHFHIVFTF